MNVGSLFAGIGGFDLGFERAGLQTLWFCEQNPYRRRVLARHWPGVPIHSDVCALVADTDEGRRFRSAAANGSADHGPNGEPDRSDSDGVPVPVPYVDVLCGGFPCQDISLAGRGAGIEGSRSGLWGEFARLIGELRPRYVVAENVPALTSRGLDRVLADLAARGFDAEWDHLPAAAFGAPHRRDRIWIVGYPQCGGLVGAEPFVGEHSDAGQVQRAGVSTRQPSEADRGASILAHPPRDAEAGSAPQAGAERERVGAGGERGGTLPDADRKRRNGTGTLDQGREEPTDGDSGARGGPADLRRPLDDPLRGRHGPSEGQVPAGRDGSLDAGWWLSEPDVGRVATRVPSRVDRLAALGDSLVPQIAEWIGRRIMECES